MRRKLSEITNSYQTLAGRSTSIERILIGLVVISILWGCGKQREKVAEGKVNQPSPKNVILMIGDGMGLAQISSLTYMTDRTSNFQRFQYIGLINTSPERSRITDSAAGATAFASGIKTYNGAIGVDVDTSAVPTIVELIEEKGIKTAVLATSSITHATPAAFYAHTASRNRHEDIATQLANSSVDFFAGGGLNFFTKRTDGSDLYNTLINKGFTIDTTQLNPNRTIEPGNRYGFLLAADGMPRMLDGRGLFLPHASRMALNYLGQHPSGFFMMIEGSQIDWGGHANDASYIITEMIDFNETLGVVMDFAEQNGETLVIVTADHETGGFALSSGESYDEVVGTFSTGGHTTTLIPVFAFGPGAERFTGLYQNSEIFHKMMQATKWPSVD